MYIVPQLLGLVNILIQNKMAAKSCLSGNLNELEEQFNISKPPPCQHSFCHQCHQGVPVDLINGSYQLRCQTCRKSCPVSDTSYTCCIYGHESSAKVNAIHRNMSFVGQESTITISISLLDGSPILLPPSCSLSPPNNGSPVQCIVKESSPLGQYNVVFTPVTRGRHQLHVTIQDSSAYGSPISILAIQVIDKPFKTITGFLKPIGVAVSNDGSTVVSERNCHSITVLNREGMRIGSFGLEGNERGQLMFPQGVAITPKRTILVVDSEHRIQEFAMEDDFYTHLSCVGTLGNGPLQFNCPYGITVNKTTGQVFIADRYNHRVQVLNPDLTFSHMFGSQGSGQGELYCPHDVAIDSKGFVFVTDSNNNRLQKFTTDGQFVSLLKIEGVDPRPSGIAIDDNDMVYINSINTDDVTVYTTNGEYIGIIKKNASTGWSALNGIACDNDTGYLYVCCTMNNVIKVFQQ